MSECLGWEVVCPDGYVRHHPFHNEDDAHAMAVRATSKRCRGARTLALAIEPPCPGGLHTVRVVAMHAEPESGSA